MSFNQRTTVFSFINKYDENTECTFTQPTVIKSSFLSTQGTCVLDGSYAGTELFHGEMAVGMRLKSATIQTVEKDCVMVKSCGLM